MSLFAASAVVYGEATYTGYGYEDGSLVEKEYTISAADMYATNGAALGTGENTVVYGGAITLNDNNGRTKKGIIANGYDVNLNIAADKSLKLGAAGQYYIVENKAIQSKGYYIGTKNVTDTITIGGDGKLMLQANGTNNSRVRGNIIINTEVGCDWMGSIDGLLLVEEGSSITFNKAANLEHSSLKATSYVEVKGGSTLNISNTGSLSTRNLLLNGGATVNVSGALTLTQNLTTITGAGNKIVLNIANDFGSFKFSNSASALTIDTNGNASTIGSLSGDGTLYLMDLVNDTIKIENIDGLVTYTEGDVLRTSNIKYGSEGNWQDVVLSSTTGGYFLNAASSVPEPAEWAAIFGAIALGFAIYRRRK